ncbi:hypothetical protein Cni_G16400 [Canna indica]|uniref:Uncharacterized protein n=1 Tax=Canna indica TaxID=4628 RepID=A0AAQ3KF26_9LILI|nr:hypothetical protein Cni_G16400 [Canna indica]
MKIHHYLWWLIITAYLKFFFTKYGGPKAKKRANKTMEAAIDEQGRSFNFRREVHLGGGGIDQVLHFVIVRVVEAAILLQREFQRAQRTADAEEQQREFKRGELDPRSDCLLQEVAATVENNLGTQARRYSLKSEIKAIRVHGNKNSSSVLFVKHHTRYGHFFLFLTLGSTKTLPLCL